MKKDENKYDANFTAGGLLFNEFRSLEALLKDDHFLLLIHEEVNNNMILGIATMSARKRIIAEIKRRSSFAPVGFWNYFFNWSENEMKIGLFYLCLKTYPLILDLHLEVALKKFKTGKTLNAYDIQMRLDEIASKDFFVASWSNSTLEKLNVQYRKAIKDASLFDGSNLTKPVGINSSFWKYFEDINETWFLSACFIKN